LAGMAQRRSLARSGLKSGGLYAGWQGFTSISFFLKKQPDMSAILPFFSRNPSLFFREMGISAGKHFFCFLVFFQKNNRFALQKLVFSKKFLEKQCRNE